MSPEQARMVRHAIMRAENSATSTIFELWGLIGYAITRGSEAEFTAAVAFRRWKGPALNRAVADILRAVLRERRISEAGS